MTMLVVDPRRSVTFDEFRCCDGPAVALDGYVVGPPRIAGDHATFDHHGDIVRATLPATCQQVLAAIDGRHPVVSPEAGIVRPGLGVYVNDCDPDVAFSVWLLTNPEVAESAAVRRLCAVEGEVDTRGGMCSGVDIVTLGTLCWVTAPWADRFAELPLLGRSEMAEIIADIGDRLDSFAAGSAGDGAAAMRDSYDLIGRHGNIWVINEQHPLGRCAAAAAGAEIVVTVRSGPADGTRTVSVCTAVDGIDLRRSWAALNAAEGVTGTDSWGGCDIVGGSPRSAGTTLDDTAICDAIALAA